MCDVISWRNLGTTLICQWNHRRYKNAIPIYSNCIIWAQFILRQNGSREGAFAIY